MPKNGCLPNLAVAMAILSGLTVNSVAAREGVSREPMLHTATARHAFEPPTAAVGAKTYQLEQADDRELDASRTAQSVKAMGTACLVALALFVLQRGKRRAVGPRAVPYPGTGRPNKV